MVREGAQQLRRVRRPSLQPQREGGVILNISIFPRIDICPCN